MLKIKENKMYKLEMVGFVKVKTDDGYKYFHHIYENSYAVFSLIVETDRSITIDACGGGVRSDNLDILYLLFESDMVEIVEENNGYKRNDKKTI